MNESYKHWRHEMSGDQELVALNIEIGRAEAEGDTGFFENLLAPQFAMRRANGVVTGRADFIRAIRESGKRPTTVDSINLVGSSRALVECTVGMKSANDREYFHNLRLFVRESPEHAWLLLAWANEAVSLPR